MSKIIGIDLGTTNSAVAIVDSGIPLVMADREGQRLTPSVVFYPDGEPPVVGQGANRVRVIQPTRTIYSIKRFMGRRGSEIADEEAQVPYALCRDDQGPVRIRMGDQLLSPEEVSSAILAKLKSDAETFLGEIVSRAVITVPAYFNDAQRTATKRAGELAGLTVERIVNEPTAAALAYGLNRLQEKSRIAVYDLGGGTFDLSILELSDGVFQVLATNGNTRLGGDDFDRRVVAWLSSQIQRAGGPNANGDATVFARVREAAEAAKIRLSTEAEIEIALPFLTPEFSFVTRLNRAELENLTRDLIERTRANCLRSLADAKVEPKDLDQVILVGGQTRMPLVREFVRDLFQCSEFESVAGSIRVGSEYHRAEGPLLNTSQNPEEAVALGAAVQAEILAGGITNVLLLDVTPLSLGLETFGGLMNVLVPRNSTIPIKAGEVFTTAVDGQTSMLIHVLQGERERAKDNWSLGQFTLAFGRAPKGTARVGVQFEIDANGILHVLARDLATGEQQVVEMRSAVDVNDADVQRMVEESVAHAFDDLKTRRWVETKVRAQETLALARQGMEELGAELGHEQCERIREAIRVLEQALATEDRATEVGDLDVAKQALDVLDQTTLPLADLIMDKAIEARLRQRGALP